MASNNSPVQDGEQKPRVLISTDIGGTDLDDNQSMVHLMMYSDLFQLEGLVSSPSFGNGSKEEILRMIDLYARDYPKLKQHDNQLSSPDELRKLCKQGRRGLMDYKGYAEPTEGSDWIVRCARKQSDQPLWVLVWGTLEDVAQALHDAPDIVSKIRIYWIGGPNKKWGANSYAYIAKHFPNVWMIENNATYRGFITDNDKMELIEEYKGMEVDANRYGTGYYDYAMKGAGVMGADFIHYYKGVVKMGDTPSLLYMMHGDANNPQEESWGGSFAPIKHSSRRVFERPTTEQDTIPVYSIVEWIFNGPVKNDISEDSVCFTAIIDKQQWAGYYLGKGKYVLRYSPKAPARLTYAITSSITQLNGLKGRFVVDDIWPGKPSKDDYQLGANWYSDRPERKFYEGKWQGAKTQRKWRKTILDDWAQRWKWLKPAPAGVKKPWDNGRLMVSANQRFLQFANGKPFFWLGETPWLMPERLNRDEVAFYLKSCQQAGFNVAQVQVLNDVPSYNIYGAPSHDENGNLVSSLLSPHSSHLYTYWDHMDYIIDVAAQNGVYIGMVCIWGGLVKSGKMNVEQAKAYGTFLANRYKNRPNIIWFMGGDVRGDVKPEVWETLATTIKSIDKNHLMTYHPRGRHTSAQWWSQASWIDFHTFQSGHRKYGHRMELKDYPIPDNTEEDNWMYVDSTWAYKPLKPVLDAEPSYEEIPIGLHNNDQGYWKASDVRRYAYWSVFGGSCGHTYGHNAIMQFYREGYSPAYHCQKTWTEALRDPGFNQMKHLKNLILSFPYFERIADQSIVLDNGRQYDRLAATRGNDYLLVYNYTGRDMKIDLRKISGAKKKVWWMDASTGELTSLGEYDNKVQLFRTRKLTKAKTKGIHDGVLIAIDSTKDYLNEYNKDNSK